jgi:catechol 2,3-dioxygenase-like lactoylglutathione lyase family enzyme
MMGAFGRFLELALPAPDVLASLGFYRALGFGERTTGDIRPWHYAVVTGGDIALGLHRDGIAEPALAFVRPNLARQVRALEDAGHEFEFQRLGAEEFNEAALRTPDGHLILMMEARTWSPGAADPATILGACTEVTLGCCDVDDTRRFFETAGFLPVDESSEIVRLNTPGITLGLPESAKPGTWALRFDAGDVRATVKRLEARGLCAKKTAEGYELRAPEGTRLVIGS